MPIGSTASDLKMSSPEFQSADFLDWIDRFISTGTAQGPPLGAFADLHRGDRI